MYILACLLQAGKVQELQELPFTPVHAPIMAVAPGMHRYMCYTVKIVMMLFYIFCSYLFNLSK